jgi:uncharacterized membrane protein YcjF (UPF0283 family)
MDWNLLKSNWALIVAAILATIIVVILIVQLLRRSAGGQLRATLRDLEKARQEEAKALKTVKKAERIVARLQEKAERAKPRHLQEAQEALGDARALAKIANDKLMVAENHVRRVIHEEYPPVKQEKLRQKYLPEPARDKKPFSF